MNVCLVASAGGHLTQLLRLSRSFEAYESFVITTDDALMQSLVNYKSVYFIEKANREQPFRLIRMLGRCAKIVLKQNPDVVISTGAAVGCITCLLAKLVCKRIVWIDSIANVDRLSLSGKIIRPFADLFLVQWPELEERYKRVKYLGTIV